MNGDGGQIIVPKKYKNTDDEGPISKKKQKNQRKNQNKTMSQQAVIEEY